MGVEKFEATDIDLSELIGREFQTVTGYENFRAFADPDYDTGRGIVRVYTWYGASGEAVFEKVGDDESRFGEHVWIGQETRI